MPHIIKKVKKQLLLFSVLFLIQNKVIAQLSSNYLFNIVKLEKKDIPTPNPFKKIEKKSYLQLLISDSSVNFRKSNKNDTAIKNLIFYENFQIISKTSDNKKFLILNKLYEEYRYFGIITGYLFSYFLELKGNQMFIYRYRLYNDKTNIEDIDLTLYGSIIIIGNLTIQ